MKISNSKKQLAKIVHENGGWRDGYDFAAQDGDDYAVWFYDGRPVPGSGRWWKACGRANRGIEGVGKLPNWHQTILSRDEYFHLYPAPDAKKEFCESVMRSIPEPEIHSKNTALTQVDDIDVVESKPTIEQLAADYRNAKYYADRKQQEADAAEADAEAKLSELVAAGKALGLVLSVVGVAPEPELVVTDWRDLKVGDEIEMLGDGWNCDNAGKIGVVRRVEGGGYNGDLPILCDIGEEESDWGLGFKFIRRP